MSRKSLGLRPIVICLFLLFLVGAGLAYWRFLTPGPGLSNLVPNPVRQGEQVRLSTSGFFPLEPLAIHVSEKEVGSRNVDLGVVQATLHGGVDAAYVALPDDLASGSHVLTVTGQISGRQTKAVLYVRAKAPWVTLASAESKPRAELGLVAGGFQPDERVQIILALSKGSENVASPTSARPAATHILADLPTDRVGNTIWSQVKLPLVAPGQYSLVVKGQTSGQQLRKDLSVTAYEPSVELSPWAGPPGTKVQLNVRGFEAGEKVAVYLGEDSRAAATLSADRYGNLWGAGPVRVPYEVGAAPLTIKLVGQDSTVQTSAQFRVLKPKPWLELTEYWGAPGGSVEFSGGGWAGGERIAFHIGSAKNPVVAYGRADDYGWLHNAGPAMIPKDASYQVTFVAVGEDSHSVATATFKIVLPFGISPVGATPTAGGQ